MWTENIWKKLKYEKFHWNETGEMQLYFRSLNTSESGGQKADQLSVKLLCEQDWLVVSVRARWLWLWHTLLTGLVETE